MKTQLFISLLAFLIVGVILTGEQVSGQTSSFSKFLSNLNALKTVFPTQSLLIDGVAAIAKTVHSILTETTTTTTSATTTTPTTTTSTPTTTTSTTTTTTSTTTTNQPTNEVDENCIFIVSTNSISEKRWSHTNTTLASLGCDVTGKVAITVHGWIGNGEKWITTLTENLLKYRGGCIIHLDWGYYADHWNYLEVRYNRWPKVSELLTRKLKQIEAEWGSPANIFMYGHSLGARMVVDAALNYGKKVGAIDACDPASVGFYLDDINIDPKKAANNVQTIHTSADAGTLTTKSHQDFLMGQCGLHQPASDYLLTACQRSNLCPTNTTAASISHNLCNDFYNNAFTNPFKAQNVFGCFTAVNANTLPAGYKMGYDETRSPAVQAIITVPTSKDFPYNVL